MTRLVIVFAFAVLLPGSLFAEDNTKSDVQQDISWSTKVERAANELAELTRRAKLREVLQLPLISREINCENTDDFVNVTKTVQDTFLVTKTLPRHTRYLVVKVRDANDAISSDGNRVEYRLRFPEVRDINARFSPTHYPGRTYSFNVEQGGWSTFKLDEAVDGKVINPNNTSSSRRNYFQLQVRVTGIRYSQGSRHAKHRVHDAMILVYDVLNN